MEVKQGSSAANGPGALVLGIETSCDETAAAVVRDGKEILANVISSQVDLHRVYGGVVPEIASRKHIELIMPVIDLALKKAGVSAGELDAIAVTYGPGLVGALLVGLSAAKAMALALGCPLVGVNHIEGHIYANVLEYPEVEPPLVCLTVSGGHTDLLYIDEYGRYDILGRTRDDAAGEAFDKIARMLGLDYPGGPEIARAAVDGDPQAVEFPRGLLQADTYDFSFSGLKTAAINYIHNLRQRGEELPVADIAASLQEAIVDVLAAKTLAAAQDYGVKTVFLSGGVAANEALRARLRELAGIHGIKVYYPSKVLCTDNAAMIACAGYYRWLRGERSPWDLNAVPSLRLGDG
ncbi:MAG: tRNA (adenosine(37)-N6)-threonylcarbamoyltransferase complex transferase subunit TsaD [Firmicutes bacterium]|jgi:N6-L-threonylcarbamoyladenine synthase|nr:tRNA (adenosine(37)-N6)-threonylcarbamoyltransferase complex transferase subunit TsaD [Bacillota bacterium]